MVASGHQQLSEQSNTFYASALNNQETQEDRNRDYCRHLATSFRTMIKQADPYSPIDASSPVVLDLYKNAPICYSSTGLFPSLYAIKSAIDKHNQNVAK